MSLPSGNIVDFDYEVVWIDDHEHAVCARFQGLDQAMDYYRSVPDHQAKLLRTDADIIEHYDPEPCKNPDIHDGRRQEDALRRVWLSLYSQRNLSPSYITSAEDLYRPVHENGQIAIDIALISSPAFGPMHQADLSPRLLSALNAIDRDPQMSSALLDSGFHADTIFMLTPHVQGQKPDMFWILSNFVRYDGDGHEQKLTDRDMVDLQDTMRRIFHDINDVEIEIMSLSMAVPCKDVNDDDRRLLEHKLVKIAPGRIIPILLERDALLPTMSVTMSAFRVDDFEERIKIVDYWQPSSSSLQSLLLQPSSPHLSSTSSLASLASSSNLSASLASSSNLSASSASTLAPSSSFRSLSRMRSFNGPGFQQFVDECPGQSMFDRNSIKLVSRCKIALGSNSKVEFLSSLGDSKELDPLLDFELPERFRECREVEMVEICSDEHRSLYPEKWYMEFSATNDAVAQWNDVRDIEKQVEKDGINGLWTGLSALGVTDMGLIQYAIESFDRRPAAAFRTRFAVAGLIRPGVNSRCTLGSYWLASLAEARAVAGPGMLLARGPTVSALVSADLSGLSAYVTADLCKVETAFLGMGLGLGFSLRTGVSVGLHRISLSLAGFGVSLGAGCQLMTPFASISLL